MRRAAAAGEFLLIFVLAPAGMAVHPLPPWPLPVLWAVTLYACLVLRQQGFDVRGLWRAVALRAGWRPILRLFVCAGALLAAAVWALAPELFLQLPRRQPLLWCLILVFYPVFSVVPQTVLYRAFLFARYAPLFGGGRGLVLASAASFAWLHVVLRNPLAPLLTFPAGLLFAWRYARTGSVAVSAFEHALYGCLVFTLGLGRYFYTGAAR